MHIVIVGEGPTTMSKHNSTIWGDGCYEKTSVQCYECIASLCEIKLYLKHVLNLKAARSLPRVPVWCFFLEGDWLCLINIFSSERCVVSLYFFWFTGIG